MNYDLARVFCKRGYTDLVAIQNKEEIEHLNKTIPYNPTYYWIGIRKLNGTWTWVGTNKTLTEEVKNWGKGEPNNKKNKEDCVEIYIQRAKDAGKWNDDACIKKKRALCYTASCNKSTCGEHGECIETINNYTCSCEEGFYGSHCQYAVQCKSLPTQPQRYMNCSHPLGEFSFQSSCRFGCSEGFHLNGTHETECLSSGVWSREPPQCTVVQCENLKHLPNGHINCTHPWGDFSYQSSCRFACFGGFQLNGLNETECLSSGGWSREVPDCTAVQCKSLPTQPQRYMNCSHPLGEFSFQSSCNFGCSEGFLLSGFHETECLSSGAWSREPPNCTVVQCENLSAQTQEFINCTHPWMEFSFQSRCRFKCPEGSHLTGSDEIECLSSGTWSRAPPHCTGHMASHNHEQDHSKLLVITGGATAASAFGLALAAWLISRRLKKVRFPSLPDYLWYFSIFALLRMRKNSNQRMRTLSRRRDWPACLGRLASTARLCIVIRLFGPRAERSDLPDIVLAIRADLIVYGHLKKGLIPFYKGVVESILTNSIMVWYGNCSSADRTRLQRTVKTAGDCVSFLDAGDHSWMPANILGDYSWTPATILGSRVNLRSAGATSHLSEFAPMCYYSFANEGEFPFKRVSSKEFRIILCTDPWLVHSTLTNENCTAAARVQSDVAPVCASLYALKE
ncbi:hypothetical protein XELAEV_18023602mg [Xenopus laevis]|uniref:p-selectin n=1 Tax=Xenopus laevis TaxID=8355 RepID=A0A974D6D4_XENLA|nr:hypothetical protein XELAEV_18023602mg [Xenopus laevis]